jgi:predicted naringenin-chalcone synthase
MAIGKLLSTSGLTIDQIQAWIIHPGGKRILDQLQTSLHLSDHELHYSREVLRLIGNVSSASVLFALDQFFESNIRKSSGPGIMMGMGPGLAIETALFAI